MTEAKKLFDKLFRRHSDPLAELRAEPSAEDRARLEVEQFELDRLDALRAGSATLSDYTNVACGPGAVIRSLHEGGLMSYDLECTELGALWHYRITPKGYDYLNAALAEP